jgi:uncharacterized protein
MIPIIVIDTSVLISALIGPDGLSRQILRNCLNGLYKPLISNALFQELEAVSSRPEILERCPLTQTEIAELLNAYYSTCHWVQIYYLWRPNLKDEGDNFLIELAVAGNAEFIVTKNIKDLKRSELQFPELRILTPEALLRG